MLMALVLAVASSLPAAAHEVRPMIATFTPGPDGSFELALSLNLEAAIVGIEPGHDTRDSRAAPDYDRLRALPPAELQRERQDFAPAFLNGIEFRVNDDRAALAVDDMAVPATGDLGLPRISQIVLRGEHSALAEWLTWRLDERLGTASYAFKPREQKTTPALPTSRQAKRPDHWL